MDEVCRTLYYIHFNKKWKWTNIEEAYGAYCVGISEEAFDNSSNYTNEVYSTTEFIDKYKKF